MASSGAGRGRQKVSTLQDQYPNAPDLPDKADTVDADIETCKQPSLDLISQQSRKEQCSFVFYFCTILFSRHPIVGYRQLCLLLSLCAT